MNRIRAATFCDREDFVNVEVRLGRGSGANGVGLVRAQDMQSGAIHIGIDRRGEDSQFAAGANDPHRDLSPISDENLLEHD